MKMLHTLVAAVMTVAAISMESRADSVPEVLHYQFSGTGTSVPNLASAPPAGTATATILGGLTQTGTDLNTLGGGFSLRGSGGPSSTDYLNTGWAPDLGTGSWTISFISSNYAASATLYYAFGSENTSFFRCFTNGVAESGNWMLRGAGLTDVIIPGGATLATQRNTFVYDSVAKQVKAYLNGALVATVAQSAPDITGAGPLKVMGYVNQAGAPAGGLLDDFRIYRRALSAAEVAEIDLHPEIVVKDGGGTILEDGTGVIDCGTLKAGGFSNSLDVTIENTGAAPLTGLSVSLDGADAGDFSAGQLPAEVAVNSSVTFSITFRPTGLGARNAVLRIASNDPDEASYDIDLTGTGTTIDTVVSEIRLGTGSPAPGAGTNGLPGSIPLPVLTSFNVPATDDAGDIAFIGKWKTPTAKGTGLFLNDKCLGVVGGPGPFAGSKWVRFSDPVVNDESVACIASLAGSPKPPASVVVSNERGTDVLDVIARTGEIAPGADGQPPVGGAVFKAFKAVSIHNGTIGFLAQLTGGTGTLKATAANDWGVWVKDGPGPLKQLIREGQIINGKTIKTLISFKPGADSPGQGRGWVTRVSGTGVAMALATMTDKTQAIVSADTNGTTIFYSQTGTTGVTGSPVLADTSFASYGLPATNDSDTNVFLASLKVGTGGVTTANARGIFLGSYLSTYTSLVRIGDNAGATGAKFAKLGDPVISEDGAVAFTAGIKGGTVKGLGAKTLWWKGPDSSLTLLAQGGTRPGPDLAPEAQWSSFSSLAISRDGNGTVFAATLVPKKGGVTAANAKGVWACDFNGVPRVLFRTGDTIGGKVVKSFTVLKATVGSTGVSRSVNNVTTVVWLAAFADKSTGIVRTAVP